MFVRLYILFIAIRTTDVRVFFCRMLLALFFLLCTHDIIVLKKFKQFSLFKIIFNNMVIMWRYYVLFMTEPALHSIRCVCIFFIVLTSLSPLSSSYTERHTNRHYMLQCLFYLFQFFSSRYLSEHISFLQQQYILRLVLFFIVFLFIKILYLTLLREWWTMLL